MRSKTPVKPCVGVPFPVSGKGVLAAGLSGVSTGDPLGPTSSLPEQVVSARHTPGVRVWPDAWAGVPGVRGQTGGDPHTPHVVIRHRLPRGCLPGT